MPDLPDEGWTATEIAELREDVEALVAKARSGESGPSPRAPFDAKRWRLEVLPLEGRDAAGSFVLRRKRTPQKEPNRQ